MERIDLSRGDEPNEGQSVSSPALSGEAGQAEKAGADSGLGARASLLSVRPLPLEEGGGQPSLETPASEESGNPVLRRDLRLSVGDGMLYGLMVGGGELFLQAFVIALGHGEVFAGLVATVPVLVGSLLQLVSPQAVRVLQSHRRWVVCCSGLQAACFLPLIAASWEQSLSATMVLVIYSIYWAASLGTGPAWNTWQGTIIPRSIRARFFAKRSRLCQVTSLAGFLGAGFALEAGKAGGRAIDVFAIVFGVACLCRMLSTTCLALQSEPEPIPQDMRFLTLREQWRKFTRGRSGRLLVFAAAMQVGVYVAGPFFVPYMLKELDFRYTDYAVLIGASFVAKFAFLPAWGRLAHRYGARPLLWIGAVGIIPLAAGWVVSSNYWWLLSLQLLAGAAWGAYELALVLLFFETIPESERTSLLTLYNVANSTALVVGSVIGAGVLKWVGLGASGYLAVFAVSTLFRLLALILLRRVPITDPDEAAAPTPPNIAASVDAVDDPGAMSTAE